MPDPGQPNVIDGQPEATRDELVAAIEARRARWDALVQQAGGRVEEPGVAGGWTLRDVVAHMNAYARFWVSNLGGRTRPFPEQPANIGFDMEKRNQWMHELDRELDWEFLKKESSELHEELLAQLRSRSNEDMRAQFVPWHPWPTWRWMCDARNHYDEHTPGLEGWLKSHA